MTPNGKPGTSDHTARLGALRDELKRRRLDGFIVPRSDEHQGEYVAPRSERLAWLTGFTGSAGLGLVLADKAAIFVDGRYTLQAEAEVATDLYDHCPLTDPPPEDWVAENLPAGAKLGYDPWLMTPSQVTRFRKATEKAGGELVAAEANPPVGVAANPPGGLAANPPGGLAANPIDAVWTDQPEPPAAPVTIHDDAFAGLAAADKRKQIAAALKESGLDAAVLTAPDSIAWLLNIRGNDVPFSPLALAFAILDSSGGVELFIDPVKLTPQTEAHLGGDVHCREPAVFGPALDRLGEAGKTVRLNKNTAPAWVLQRLEAAGAKVDGGFDPCQLPKARKTPAQLDGIRSAHRRDGAALTRFLAWLAAEADKGSLMEMACADKLESLRRENEHFRGLSFPTISGAGPNGAIVHYRVSEKTDAPLSPGTLYLVDSGAQYLDGTTDVTRTIAIGKPTAEMRRNFTLVLKGHIALATARFPALTTGSQLDVLARRALWAEGLDYDHGTGHGVGHYLGVHEGPQRIAKTPNRVALEPGMVVSNEPGYYKSGAYGIRIENLVTVVEVESGEGKPVLGFETLTLAPIDRALIDLGLLTSEEIAWIDAYHARVADEIGPLVDEATKEWLEQATRPIG